MTTTLKNKTKQKPCNLYIYSYSFFKKKKKKEAYFIIHNFGVKIQKKFKHAILHKIFLWDLTFGFR